MIFKPLILTCCESNNLLVESSIKEAGEKLSHLEKYEYDENCEYCLTNGKHQIEDKRFMEKNKQKN